MEELKLLEILKNIRNLLENNFLYEAKQYIQIEINNIDGTTEKNCKNTYYYFYDTYCKWCSNYNCSSNKNTG